MKVIISHDADIESPRTFDNLGTMYCWHKRYQLGDIQPKCDPVEHQKCMPEGSVILPLYLIDHSGISMSTSDYRHPWDSGRVGYIVVTPEDIRKEFSCKRISAKMRAKVAERLKQEVEIYDDYLTGNVYQYELQDDEGEVTDSCCGFYGKDIDGMVYNAGSESYREAIKEAFNNVQY